jgi:hypothetical protein
VADFRPKDASPGDSVPAPAWLNFVNLCSRSCDQTTRQRGGFSAQATGSIENRAAKEYFSLLPGRLNLIITRRHLIQGGAAVGIMAAARPAAAATVFAAPAPKAQIDPKMFERARAALESKRPFIKHSDVIGIADYSKASREPRFYLVNMLSGMVTSYHVAHGRGSDPAHSGWLEHFSNTPGSEASSNGAYVTGDIYYGKYGRSLRLTGLDPTNNNALNRAIVIHGAWYAEPEVVERFGKLGRSEGCFALSETNLQYVLYMLGPGRLLYSDKV